MARPTFKWKDPNMDMMAEEAIARFRREAIELAIKNGFTVLDRPKAFRFDERHTVFLPDMRQERDTGLRIGDCVHVRQDIAWGFQEEKFVARYNETLLYVLGFAKVDIDNAKCRIEGTFCLVAKQYLTDRHPSLLCDGKKVHLIWAGGLEKWEDMLDRCNPTRLTPYGALY